jgi:integrase
MPKPKGRHPVGRLRDFDLPRLTGPARHADGGCLYLAVSETGARSWIVRVVENGRRRDLGIGAYPLVSLSEARASAFLIRKAARAGQLIVRTPKIVPTFREVAERVIAENESRWTTPKVGQKWSGAFATYVYPFIGDVRVDHVTRNNVLSILAPIWTTKAETARRIRQRMSAVFDYAKAHDFRSGDSPMEGIDHGLAKQPRVVTHMTALPYARVPDFLIALRKSRAFEATKLALEFQILTAARPGEVRNATWSEINIAERLHTIPRERYKTRAPHSAALSTRALAIIDAARAIKHPKSDLVFPSKTGRALSDVTFKKLASELGFGPITAHGFRSSFRDWAAERTDFQNHVVEMALGHAISNAVEAAYRRGNLLDKRRELVQVWANFACGVPNGETSDGSAKQADSSDNQRA